MNWYEIQNISIIDSPALVLYKDRIKQNILRAISMVPSVDNLRPHVKTNKIAEVCSMMMGEGIYKFKCATIAEAEMLGMIHAKDVLFAYQPVGKKIDRLVQLVKTYPATSFSCLIDNASHAAVLSKAFEDAAFTVNVFIDLNVGMNRSGIKPEKALDLFKTSVNLKGLNPIGLHGYDGHIHDPDPTIRKQRADLAFDQVSTLADSIYQTCKVHCKIVAGGTPTFPVHAARYAVECSPGTFVFWDWGYKHAFADEPFEFAALVITRVISIVDDHTICVDLGHKSVASEMPLPRVHFLNAPDAVAVSHSEEHLVLQVKDAGAFKLGDILYGVPVHICPTVALYDKAFVLEDGEIIGSWNVVARNRSISI